MSGCPTSCPVPVLDGMDVDTIARRFKHALSTLETISITLDRPGDNYYTL